MTIEAQEDAVRALARACVEDAEQAVDAMRRWRWLMLASGVPAFGWSLLEFWRHHWLHGGTLGLWALGSMFICEGFTDFIALRQRGAQRVERLLTEAEIEAIRRRLG